MQSNKVKVYDCFPYFNEKELLELRIKLIYDYVDGFYIVDADHTHSGHPKEFSCVETLKELGIPLDKIKVIHINLPSYEQNTCNYVREKLQRDVVSNFFVDDAVYIVSDCDEIINPEFINVFVDGALSNPNNIMRISLVWLTGKANLKVQHFKNENVSFNTPFVCMKHHTEKYSLSQIRDEEACKLNTLIFPSLYLLDQNKDYVECGWHFSWMGGRERIIHKMKSFLHSYDANTGIFSSAAGAIGSKEMQDYLDHYDPIEGSSDPYGRTEYFLQKYPIENLPKILFELKHLKNYFFGNGNEITY